MPSVVIYMGLLKYYVYSLYYSVIIMELVSVFPDLLILHSQVYYLCCACAFGGVAKPKLASHTPSRKWTKKTVGRRARICSSLKSGEALNATPGRVSGPR